MSKRLFLLACVASLVAAACSETPQATIDFGSGQGFVPFVADFLDNVGLGSAVAVDQDGVPFTSYWGFPAKVEPGAIPTTRPIGSPFLPAVLVASEAGGVFTRGAAAQAQDTPAGITIPYAPPTEASLASATATNTNGTDIAVDADGGKHVVWAANTGIWYATGTTSFAAEQVTRQAPQLNRTGPLGWPSVAVGADGTPWIAFTTNTGAAQDVTLATKEGDRWTTAVVASSDLCPDCAQPQRTEVVIGPSGPVVLYVDNATQAVMAAVHDPENAWVSFQIESGVSGVGLAATVDADGTLWVSYFTGQGAVDLATSTDGSGWTASKAVDAGEAAEGNTTAGITAGMTTGIATTDDGTIYLTWADPVSRDVQLVKGSADGSFERVDVGSSTQGGAYASVAASADGSQVFLTWYDTGDQDLLLGVWGEVDGLAVAAPSPTPTNVGPPLPTNCGDDGQLQLDVSALGTAFNTNCLVAPAGQAFAITFENQEAVLHNLSGYTAQGGDQLFTDDPFLGPSTINVDVDPLDAGTYYFQCDVHPTVMNGTLAVIKSGGGGGNGGGGNGGGANS